MKLRKIKFSLGLIFFCLAAMAFSGCAVYANNKDWDAMAPQEKQEARQAFGEAKAELEEEFSGSGLEYHFVSDILHMAGQAMDG